jgi:hypothetical protein
MLVCLSPTTGPCRSSSSSGRSIMDLEAVETLLTMISLLYSQGAHHTFDSPSFLAFLASLRTPTLDPIPFPTFDHKLKDPLPSPISISPGNRIVSVLCAYLFPVHRSRLTFSVHFVSSVIEGLYLLLDLPPWSDAADYWAEKIWLDIPAGVARKRLVTRHLETGVETVLDAAEKRGPYEGIFRSLRRGGLLTFSYDSFAGSGRIGHVERGRDPTELDRADRGGRGPGREWQGRLCDQDLMKMHAKTLTVKSPRQRA